MSPADQVSLRRVTKFDQPSNKFNSKKQDQVIKSIYDRIADSEKIKEETIKKIAKKMIDAGNDLEMARKYLDDDDSGTISREEMADGFKNMGIVVGSALLKNLMVILDKDGDNEIDMLEFEQVFGKFFAAGGPVKVLEAEEVENLVEGISKEDAKALAKDMKNEIKTA